MKKITIFAILFILLYSNSCKKGSSSNVNLNSGLVAYYPFNGNANDAGPNKLNGVVNGGVTFSNDISGNVNSAATFDGSTGYIYIKDSLGKFQTNAVSVSFLTNLRSNSTREAFITSMNFFDASGYSYSVAIQPNYQIFQFGVQPNIAGCTQNILDNANSVISGTNIIVPNKWYNVVVIFSDSLQEIFVNGVLNSSSTRNFATLNQCSNNKGIVIGGWWQGDLVSINGSLDEMRIYNRALNQDEITELAKPVQ